MSQGYISSVIGGLDRRFLWSFGPFLVAGLVMNLTIGFETRVFVCRCIPFPLFSFEESSLSPCRSPRCYLGDNRLGRFVNARSRPSRSWHQILSSSAMFLGCTGSLKPNSHLTAPRLQLAVPGRADINAVEQILRGGYHSVTLLLGTYYDNTWPIARGGARHVVDSKRNA